MIDMSTISSALNKISSLVMDFLYEELHMDNFTEFITKKTKDGTIVVLEELLIPLLILFGCACLVWAYVMISSPGGRKGKDIPGRRALSRSLSMAVLRGGELAIQRLVDYHEARTNISSWDAMDNHLDNLLAQEFPNFKELQRTLAKLEMAGKEAMAVEKLERALTKARKEGKSHEAYEFEMLLVEMLIYKGDFGKALQCSCLQYKEISDARRPLYKAIIHILLDHPKDEAMKCWKEFKEIRRHFEAILQDSGEIHEVVTYFAKFESVVKQLRKDIDEAQQQKTVN